MEIISTSATLQFFAIFQPEKVTLVLPKLLSKAWMNKIELESLPFKDIQGGSVKIPVSPKPWSEIKDNADMIFIMIHSRRNWGANIDEKTNLLEIPQVQLIAMNLQRSIQNYSLSQDIQSGKFLEGTPDLTKIEEQKTESIKPTDIGVRPGQSWDS